MSCPRDSRRLFIGKVASGLAGTMASPSAVLGANSRIRLGVIGSGDRGLQLIREALSFPNTEVVAFSDVYVRRLDEARRVAPDAKTFLDYRALLDDNSVDGVIVATPQHLHCEHFVAALDAGKHVYVEKTLAFTVDHAKRMRAAFKKAAGHRVVQVGHQTCSSAMAADAAAFVSSGKLGRITAIEARHFRNTPHGKAHWSRPVYPDVTPDNVQWSQFLGEAAPGRDFDANRFVNWRLFWDYSGGNVFENMCHQAAFWYKVLDLQIPRSATMTGGVFLWKDGREVPDTMHVSLVHSEELLFSWSSGFGNNHLGSSEEVLGTDGTLSKSATIRYTPQKVNQPSGRETIGQGVTPKNAHIGNFLSAIRGGKETNCSFDIGFRVSIACRMAVESYRQHRTVFWDPIREEIV